MQPAPEVERDDAGSNELEQDPLLQRSVQGGTIGRYMHVYKLAVNGK